MIYADRKMLEVFVLYYLIKSLVIALIVYLIVHVLSSVTVDIFHTMDIPET